MTTRSSTASMPQNVRVVYKDDAAPPVALEFVFVRTNEEGLHEWQNIRPFSMELPYAVTQDKLPVGTLLLM